jgi:hypothetical protein
VIKNASVKIGATEYAGDLKSVMLSPSSSVTTYKTLIPASIVQDVDAPSWSMKIEGLQNDTGASTSLAEFLTANHGTTATFIIAPANQTGAKKATVTAVCIAVDFGGVVGEYGSISVELPVVGQPTWGVV